jgi:hypothetical protein
MFLLIYATTEVMDIHSMLLYYVRRVCIGHMKETHKIRLYEKVDGLELFLTDCRKTTEMLVEH